MTQHTAGQARTKTARRKPTDQERAERREEDRQRLDRATRELLESEGWRRWVMVRSRNGLSRYSFGNQLLIAMQCPEATYVSGFRAFLELGRCVRKGERAIRILAPMSVRTKDAGKPEASEEKEEDARRLVFRAVPVFDVSQTEVVPGTEPVPLSPPSEPVDGDSHRGLLKPLEEVASELGYTVSRRVLNGSAEGWCDAEKKEIVLNSAMAANGQVRVLVHEIAHAMGIDYAEYGRRAGRGPGGHGHVYRVQLGGAGRVGVERPVCRRVGRGRRARSDPEVRGDNRRVRAGDRRGGP